MISALSIVWRSDYTVTEFWRSEVQLLTYFFFFTAITNLNLETRHLNIILKLMIILSVPIGLYGVYQLPARFLGWPFGAIAFTNPTMAGLTIRIELINIFTRAASIFSEPSWFGHYMVTMLALSIPVALHNPRYFGKRWILFTIITIQIISLVFSRSVGAYFGFALLILLMLILERSAQRHKIILAIIYILGLGFLVTLSMQVVSGYPFVHDILSRIYGVYRYILFSDPNFTVSGESLFGRIDMARVGYKVWLDYPLSGVGLGQYSLVSPAYGNPHPGGASDSTLIATMSEMGILGIVSLLGFIISSLYGLKWAFRKMPYPDREKSLNVEYKSLRLCGKMVFYLILIESIYFHMLGSLFWVSTWIYFSLGGLVALTELKFRSGIAQGTPK
jgi:O-antigen ligase